MAPSPIDPTPAEVAQRCQVVETLLDYIQEDRRILLPQFDPSFSIPSEQFALQSVGIEANAFGGTVGDFRYQFEGEEDLLHLFITRVDGGRLAPEDAQPVVTFLLPNLPQALLWLKPGEFSQHFYFGHDELL
ncbi:MAG TPA: hypothetical protein VJ835_07870 [Fimbriimonadaceae bacterium]|nr:hypothetical protein [Fimbriimonadaceae bacterium]